MTRRAAVYVRISRDRAGEGAGVSRQEADCRDLADHLGWEVADVYSDNDISASSGVERPAYQRLLEDIAAGQVEGVLAWAGDRLHRSVIELDTFLTIVAREGVQVRTVRDGELTPPADGDNTMALIRGVIAQGESAKTRARVRRAKLDAAADGKYRGGPRPFGYESDGTTVREVEAAVLRKAAADLLSGRSLAAVTRTANEGGSVTARGTPHSSTAMARALRRPRNAALVERHGTIVGPARWPAILDEDTWRAVVALLTDPSRRTNVRGSERRWLLSGLALCGVCGGVVRVVVNAADRRSYRCETSASHVSRIQPPVDDLVLRAIVERLSLPDVRELLADDADAAPLHEAQAAAQALRVREEELASMFSAGDITGAQLKAGSARLSTERKRIESEVAALTGQLRLGWLAGSPDPAEAFLAAPLDKQRAVVDALLSVVILKAPRGRPAGWRKDGPPMIEPASVELRWKS